ncbi:MAG: alkane 1-monooxygenase [Bacteroidetes bacterium]|nr:alkane 1-monooxygenase [Bacteroidota bacterium]
MFRNLGYLWSLLPGIITITGNVMGGFWVYGNLVFSLVILSAVEWFMPENKSNRHSKNDFVPDMILIFHVILQMTSLVALFYSFSAGRIQGHQIIGAAISTGILSGTSAIVVAHELVHRKSKFFRSLGKLLLFSAGNIYFYVEHLRGHHKWVGTDKDPATAKRGESLYRFFVRSMSGQIKSAWHLEEIRLKKEGRSVLNNAVLQNSILQAALLVGLFIGLGPMAVAIYLHQVLVANFLLEYTNYIEHYGLTRTENERVKEDLSWQTDKVVSRFFLIDLSRHSDHHYYSSKPYHTLETHANSPKLPGGYASAIYLALFPPLWFKVVDRCLDNFKNSEIEKFKTNPG